MPAKKSEPIVVKGLELVPDENTAKLNGKELRLTPKEFGILCFLAGSVGTTLNRTAILEEVWGSDFYSSRTVDVHIVRLRQKLGRELTIETVWGGGYRLVA